LTTPCHALTVFFSNASPYPLSLTAISTCLVVRSIIAHVLHPPFALPVSLCRLA
jgi:hypothetical protein